MIPSKNKTVLLFLTHIKNKTINRQISRLFKQCSNQFDIFVLCDNSEGKFDRYKDDRRFFLFDVSQLRAMGYPAKSASETLSRSNQGDYHHRRFNFDPGNVELPVLLFFKAHPEYDHFWTIEYDVRFSGAWDRFFSTFEKNDADLLGTTLTRYERIPGWFHWPSLDLGAMRVGKDAYLRGFFPVYRLSRRALERLDRDYRTGVKGHFECLVPTLLQHAGMTIEDIGGDGELVRPGNVNRFYRNTPTEGHLGPGTFVFRPIMERPGDEPNTLWHPVKPSPLWKSVLRSVRRALMPVATQPARNGPAAVSVRSGSDPRAPLARPIVQPQRGDRLN